MKKKLLIILFLCFILFMYLFIYYKVYSFIFIIIIFLMICFLIKKYIKISIINIDKLKNLIKTRKIIKKISNDECYLKKIKIDTFDGSNGTTHPYVIYFENGFNGYKYYMVHTPYDNNNVELENPSLVVSNDGINFIKPNGISDPLLPIIKQKNNPLKYYSDPWILFDNEELQIWYRYTEEDKVNINVPLINKIYRITTKDGINFSEPELMIENDGIWYLSPSIIKLNDIYYMYYFDKDLKLYCKTSNDLKNWSKERIVKNNKFKGKYWHGEVKLINDKLYLLFLSKDYKLFLCESDINNPLNFEKCDELHFNYYDKCNIYGNVCKYKSTFLINDKYINLYIPYKVNTINWFKLKRIKHIKWTMTNTCLSLDNYNKYVKDGIK